MKVAQLGDWNQLRCQHRAWLTWHGVLISGRADHDACAMPMTQGLETGNGVHREAFTQDDGR